MLGVNRMLEVQGQKGFQVQAGEAQGREQFCLFLLQGLDTLWHVGSSRKIQSFVDDAEPCVRSRYVSQRL